MGPTALGQVFSSSLFIYNFSRLMEEEFPVEESLEKSIIDHFCAQISYPSLESTLSEIHSWTVTWIRYFYYRIGTIFCNLN